MSGNHSSYSKILILAAVLFLLVSVCHGQKNSVQIKWLSEKSPEIKTGVSWGVPWPRGVIQKGQDFMLTTNSGESLPLQTWPMAYWPDGSVKWTGCATVTGSGTDKMMLAPGKGSNSDTKIEVSESAFSFKVKSGDFSCLVPKKGNIIVDSLTVNSVIAGKTGKLECLLIDNPGDDPLHLSPAKKYSGYVGNVTVEQNGPVRVVIKVQGTLKEESGPGNILPFTIRLYFYAGTNSVRIVNTIIYDGNPGKDFIKGLSFSFSVPMKEQLQNRHVRFSGELPGIWAEPVKPLTNRAGMLNGKRSYPDQLAGKRVANLEELQNQQKELVGNMPSWNDYRLVQNNADGFIIQKRTNAESAWIDAGAGTRAGGFVFAGDVNAGLSAGLKDFWQSYPSAVEINNATKDNAELRIWLWSPYSDAMDMRHYDTVGHGLAATYEDVQEGLSTPYGVSRTSELVVYANTGVPDNNTLSQQAGISAMPPHLTVTPEYLHSVKAFGIWSLPDRSLPGKAWIENQLDKAIDIYKKEIDQRNWYGFWNYGDVMHAYDPDRHSWNYDIGGYAWDNTELSSDLWLWYSYVRSGREDIFVMAEAMSRHTSEVDVYHMGPLKGLGSRHNVRHWGCGSKEVRESQSLPKRIYYYLTTDERTGDIMTEVAENADISMSKLDPLRLILPKTQYPTHIRIGPDWLAIVGNWMTEWERTGDNKWLEYINAGIKSYSKMPYGFYSGEQGAFGYDPATKKIYQLNDEIGHIHLSALMGGPEVGFELTWLIKNKNWDKLFMQFCQLWGAPADEVGKAFGKKATVGQSGNNWYSRLPAYVYHITGNEGYAEKAWSWFLNSTRTDQFNTGSLSGVSVYKPLDEAARVTTNSVSQWCLNAIEVLEMAGDKIPAEHQLWAKSPDR